MPFVQMARAWRESGIRQREDRERAEDRERSRATDEIRMAALLAGLSEQGIVPNDQVPTAQTPSMPGVPSMRVPTARRLGDTGYAQDLTRTAQAREFAEQRKRAETIGRRKLVLKVRVPELKDAPDHVLEEYASNDDLYESALRPAREQSVNWVTRTDGDGRTVQIHPRTGQVRTIPGVTPRRRSGGTTNSRAAAIERARSAVQTQLNEARSDYNTARRGVAQRPAFFRAPADSVAFEGNRREADRLKQRVDSLSGVRDRYAGEVQAEADGVGQGSGGPKLSPLTPSQISRARNDPEYRQFLIEKGYSL